MSNNNKTPAIRFKGFTDTWEQRKFSELTEIRSASRVHKEEWQSSGVPFYRSSDVMAALNGTENEKAFISEELYEKLSAVSGKLEKGDVLVTGGGSVGKPYIVPNNEPLYTKDADLLWIKNNENLDPYFVYTFFFSPTFTDYLNSVSHVGTIAHYTITQLGETPITLPCVSEQQKIGDYFRNLDSIITLHQRKYDKLIQFKAAMLEKMFPQNGADKPEIRFKGFTDAWEQRSLSSFCNYISSSLTAKDIDENGKYDLYDANTLIGKTNKGCIDEDYITIIKDGAGVGRTRLLPSKSMFLGTMGALIPDKSDLNFLYQLIINADLSKEYTGSTIPHIYFINYGKNKYFIPSIAEQRKIGTYFRNLDSVITLHQRKCDKYKSIKAGLIRKLFP